MGAIDPADIVVTPETVPETTAELVACLADWEWRLFSGQLYKIIVKDDDDPEDPGVVMPFKPNRAQRRFLRRLHYRNVVLKARQLGLCVDPSTRVLTADLTWQRIDTLQPGQEIVAVDEFPPGGKGKARSMRTGTVERVGCVKAQAFRITFDDGRSVTCTDRHPWLSKKAKVDPAWRSISGQGNAVTGKLKVGTKVRWIAKPWDEPTVEDGWFGGMLDGEGSFAKSSRNGAHVSVSQREGPVWDRLNRYAKSRGYSVRVEADKDPSRNSKHGNTAVPKLCFSRMDELFRLIGQTRPTRGLATRFWEGKELPGKRNGGVGWATITSIEPLGEQTLIDLQTSTGTYIAEGFVSHNTTLACILFLDHALFNSNQRCGIICQNLTAAETILRDKVKFAWENLPPAVRASMPLDTDNAEELVFAHNNSSIRVAVSMRSGTMHRLHVSELGKIAKESRKHAREIVTGSLPAVAKTGVAIIESTAEGQEGEFFDIASAAQRRFEARTPLSIKQWRFHFFPWFLDPGYVADPEGVAISSKDHQMFAKVEAYWAAVGEQVKLTLHQRAWYVLTRDEDFSGADDLMWQEYPSTPDEAWQRSTEGAFFAKELAKARAEQRITDIPHLDHVPVHTFWDIGASDGTAIWGMQYVGMQERFIDFWEDWDKPYSHFVNMLVATGYTFGTHFLPHDVLQKRQRGDRVASALDDLQELAPSWTFQVVPRIDSFQHGITKTRSAFSRAYFDRTRCAAGITHLQEYRKKWNSTLGVWSDKPDKDNPHTEAADGFRQWAQGFDPALIHAQTRPRRRHTGGRTV